ncbi:MAG: LPS-assembly protein LptD, partial [Thermodesulfobacteriota bacterium]
MNLFQGVSGGDSFGNGDPWQISADRLFYDQNADHYVAEGHAVIQKKNVILSADFIRFDHHRMEAIAVGNAVMTDGEDILSGDRVSANLNSATGIAYHGTVFFKEHHFFIRSSQIEKTGEKTYTATQASITACDGDNPAWKITGHDVKVTIEGYATAWHASLQTKGIPIVYTPYIFLPVKTKRQSGLLAPLFGNSERKGFEYGQPYFWVIGPSSD